MAPVRPHNEKKSFAVTFLPFGVSLEVPAGTSILDAARSANLPLRSTCGGRGTCGECVVRITSGAFTGKAAAALSERLAAEGYALACLAEVNDDLTIRLPQFQQLSIKSVSDSTFFDEHKDELSGAYEIRPEIETYDLHVPPATLEENYSDLKRMERELRRKYRINNPRCEYGPLRGLARAVRENDGNVTIILYRDDERGTIIDIKPKYEKSGLYGIACDLGTTTVSVQLVDLDSGKILRTASSYNQQIKCGEDVISRINYARDPEKLHEAHTLAITTINQLIEQAISDLRISSSDIYYASVSGNTTMTHLFLNIEPRYIREEPYVPTVNSAPIIPSDRLGLRMNPEGRVHCAPAVGSYVGGDITAGLLCTPILRDAEKVSLFIDVGTNGELVVGNSEWLMGCACSAGPAFEGSGIKCGMPATEGAIERLRLHADGTLDYEVIGDSKPKGLCGSGLIDLLAELLVHGYIDRSGTFNDEKATSRIIDSETGACFLVLGGEHCFWERDLVITENDIKNLIRTKGAVFSACSLLLKNVGFTYDKLDAIYIAGGFGRYLDIENAIRIGLFPDVDRSKFHYLGNSSLLGSYLILISDRNRKLVNEIANKMTYLELSTEPGYMNEYTGALFLPHTHIDYFPSVKKLFDTSP